MEYILMFLNLISSFIEKCNNNGVLNFLGLIFSTIIPIYIMNKTLKHEKKVASQDAIKREQQYHETIMIAEQRHKEQIKAQEDINRVAIMPYLTIKQISTKIRNDRVEFLILFKNIGNGTAINLTTKYLESNTHLCPVCKTILATYCCAEPFDAYISVARPDEICQLTISQVLNDTTTCNLDCFKLTVKYTDMKQQPYEQSFAIYFDATNLENIKLGNVIINNPEPIIK